MRAKMADAQWTPTAHYAFHVDTKPPQPTNVVPRNGARWGGSTLRIAFDEDGSGINLKSVVMKIGTHVFQWGHKALRFDASRNELALNLQSVGVTLRDGELVRCKLLPLSDRAGNVSKPLEWHWRMSYRLDKQPPCAPIIKWSGPQPLGGGGFETPEQCWESYGQDVVIKRVQYQPASGQYCLMMQCIKDGGAFGAYIHRQPFDARQYPIIAFDYRISKHLRADFVLSHSGNLRSIHFADNDNPFIPLGSVTDVQRDERWHHAEIPLLKWVSNSALNPPMRINWLTIQDMGWRGNAEGETAYFDNFVLVPLTSSARGLEFRWMATDVSGISASAYRIDHHPNTNPSTKRKIQATHVRIAKPISGDFYLHVKVRDGAGNWSAPSHFRFLADGQPPRLQLIKPKLNARGAPSEVVMKLTDDFIGVDVAQMRIRIGKRLFDITSQAVVYDRERGELRWRHLCTSTAPAWADGMRIEGVVENVRDYAGNAVRKPLQFAFIVDYQYDDEPPEVIVESPTHAVLLWQDFERNIPWRSTGGVKIVKDGSTSAGGQCSVRITNAQDGGNMNVIVCDEPFDARMYPILRFDYRIPPGVRLDFVV
ncbi:MAG TPA: hypothetical protein EYP10_13975, partial [Armatimonadetes bacterium]|nr:hypothetical protein [Armatimonadota bacterium]